MLFNQLKNCVSYILNKSELLTKDSTEYGLSSADLYIHQHLTLSSDLYH